MTLISVIIPAYNAEPFIARAVHSALAQKDVDLEVVIADDASKDNTVSVCESLVAEDSRVKFVRCAQNGGAAAARNRAIEASGGDWVAVLDADDEYEPGRLAILLALAEEKGADIVADNHLFCDASKNKVLGKAFKDERLTLDGPLTAAEFVRNDWSSEYERPFGFLKPMIKSEFMTHQNIRYDETIRGVEDFPFFLTMLLSGAKTYLTPQALYRTNLDMPSVTRTNLGGSLRNSENSIRSGRAMMALAQQRGDMETYTTLKRRQKRLLVRDAYLNMLNAYREKQWGKIMPWATQVPFAPLIIADFVGEIVRKKIRGRPRISA